VACFLLAGVRRGTVTLDLYLFRFRDFGRGVRDLSCLRYAVSILTLQL
jgi:hypothetical protein